MPGSWGSTPVTEAMATKPWAGGCASGFSSECGAPFSRLILTVCSLSVGSFGKLEERGVNLLYCCLLLKFTRFSSTLE